MNAQNVDLEIVIGLPFIHYLNVADAMGQAYDPTPNTFTGSIVTWVGKTAVTDFVITTGADEDGNTSVILSIAANTTSALTPGVYRYDVLMTEAATNDVVILSQGKVMIFDTATTP